MLSFQRSLEHELGCHKHGRLRPACDSTRSRYRIGERKAIKQAAGEDQLSAWLVGVDTGGTFTDLIAVEQATGMLRRAKVPSVPHDPSIAVLHALEKLFADGIAPADISMFVHGTTVATNALLEGKGVRVGLLITRGFRAVY